MLSRFFAIASCAALAVTMASACASEDPAATTDGEAGRQSTNESQQPVTTAPRGTAGAGTGAPGVQLCSNSSACPSGQYCTTEDGRCNPPPDCGGNCPAGCWGECVPDTRARCGPSLCTRGEVCCNESCGICAAPGVACPQLLCDFGLKAGSTTPPLRRPMRAPEGLPIGNRPPGITSPTHFQACGANECNPGEVCCNESCGICAPLGAHCYQGECIVHVDPTTR